MYEYCVWTGEDKKLEEVVCVRCSWEENLRNFRLSLLSYYYLVSSLLCLLEILQLQAALRHSSLPFKRALHRRLPY